jgi:hypothetical protein
MGFVGTILGVSRSEPCSEIGEGVTDCVTRPRPNPTEILVKGSLYWDMSNVPPSSVDTAAGARA